jgi:NMD protein affecting ribosome stability and mRNA decay
MARNLTGKHGAYFEAVLQLRDISPKVIDYAEDEIARVKLHVAKVIKLKNGFDYYLSDNSLARALGKRLQEKFGGEHTVTASLWGVKKDREVYRVTVLFRGIQFEAKDIVEYKKEQYVVKSLGKDIFLQNEKTGKKVHVRYKNMGEIKTIN